MPKPLRDRLESKLDIRGKNKCWVWRGAKVPYGYGVIAYNGQLLVAHRVAYQLYIGRIPTGKKVLRTCRNKYCCNPRHLVIGTMKQAHEILGLERNDLRRGKCELTKRQRQRIKERALSGDTAARIQKDYPSIHYATVLQYVRDALK